MFPIPISSTSFVCCRHNKLDDLIYLYKVQEIVLKLIFKDDMEK